MLYSTPPVSVYTADLMALEALQRALPAATERAAPLARQELQGRADAARGAVAIEGHRIERTLATAVLEGRAAATGRQEQALAGAALALHHVEVLADDPSFAWSDRLLLDLHFECCWQEPRAHAGRWRTGPVWRAAPEGGQVYQAPPAQAVKGHIDALVRWLSRDDDKPAVVRAAMAHLHLVALQPFADGNGRMACVLQSLVLARAGLSATEQGAVQERFRRDPGRYHAVLNEVLGSRYQPTRSAAPWLAFCIDAHLTLARERLALLERSTQRWSTLQGVVATRGLPSRLAHALEQSLDAGIDRASYAATTGVAVATASTDLRRVMDAGLVERVGQARDTHYVASEALRQLVARP